MGPLTQLAVQRGDTLSVTAPGYYPQAVASAGFSFSLLHFVAGLLQPGQSGAPNAESSRRGALPLLQLGLSAGLAPLTQPGNGVPQGYP